MVSDLHWMGFQRARIMPHLHLSYRVWIAPAIAFSRTNPAFIPEGFEPSVQYYSASDNHYFHWTDATNDSARQLADKFVVRFPEIVAMCEGRDWAYAGWLAELVGHLENEAGRLPVVMQECQSACKRDPRSASNRDPLGDDAGAGGDGR